MNRQHWETLAETLVLVIMTAVLCLMVWAPPAYSQEKEKCIRWCILPPIEYDHPFAGTVKIETVPARNDLKTFCSIAFIAGLTLGCSRRHGDVLCHIVLVDEKIIKEQGWTRELMLRHEIGHCNGWPGDHPGQRAFNAK